MKTCLFLSLVALMTAPALSQPQPEPPRQIPTRSLALPAGTAAVSAQGSEPTLTRFSLDFPGGTPKQLIAAIEKAMGKPVNAIIPEEHADVKLPPLKMANVDVWQLFQALELASQKTESYATGTAYYGGFGKSQQTYQQMRTSYGFRTSGTRSDDSIWYFSVEKPNPPPLVSPVIPMVCRFYPLTAYLERGLTVDDITTAIQTGWKMLGDEETPKISFHKETKLLIAVGEERKLLTIDAALEALGKSAPPMPPLKSKTEN